MKQHLGYRTGQRGGENVIFTHVYEPDDGSSKALVVFFNPLLDEKKRVQKFQVNMARNLASNSYTALRFDYYGTGDSLGELTSFDLAQSIEDSGQLVKDFAAETDLERIFFIGIRAGADLALQVAAQMKSVNLLILVEPVVSGKRYLTEQRLRRKAFFKLNEMRPVPDEVTINGQPFEDFQGYPLSSENISFLNAMDSEQVTLSGQQIVLVKVATFIAHKGFERLSEHLGKTNLCTVETIPGDDFWARLEVTSPQNVIDRIVQIINDHES